MPYIYFGIGVSLMNFFMSSLLVSMSKYLHLCTFKTPISVITDRRINLPPSSSRLVNIVLVILTSPLLYQSYEINFVVGYCFL